MTIERNETDYEQPYATSPTDHVLTELQLHGYRPFQDEPDPRPLPEARIVAAAVADIFDALIASLSETRLEPDLEDLLWSTVNLFHRANERIERELDDNEQAQKRSQTRPGWLRNPLGRTGASHCRGHDTDRAAQQHGISSATRRPNTSPATPDRTGIRAAARW